MKRFDTANLRLFPPWLALLLGLAATGLAGYWLKLDAEQDNSRQFAFYCDEIRLKIEARLDAHQQILLSGAAMFDASEAVSRQEWRIFVQRLLGDAHFRGIQGLGYASWLLPGQLAAHQAKIRAEGFPHYTVTPEGQRDAYSPIVYLEPFSGRNLRAFGYDMYSEPVRRAAMARARDENQATLSGKVQLVQETAGNMQAGTLMYVPVYHNNRPADTLEQRRAAIMGWVYSPFRMGDLFNNLMTAQNGKGGMPVRLRVYDQGIAHPDNLLYTSAEPSHVENAAPLPMLALTAHFNGTAWALQFEQAAHANAIDYSKMWIILATGSFSSFLLFLLLRASLIVRGQALTAAHQLSTQLSESEQSFRLLADSAPVLIWQSHTEKQRYYFNKAWLSFTGRTLAQEQGEGWAAGVHPDDLQQCADTSAGAFAQRANFSMEYRLRRHDGEYRWLIDEGTPRFADDKTFLGYIGFCLDITERKRIEYQFAQAHRQLQQFTYIAAHHLQEPARRLVIFAQRLRSQLPVGQLNEDALASLQFIEQGAARQSALVRDIQLYLAADQPRSSIVKVPVAELIDALLEERAALIHECRAKIDYAALGAVDIDRPRLKDIFSILLDNALQYRHPDRALQVRITGTFEGGRMIYRLADNGIGIAAEFRERVFGVFERLQVSHDQNSTGIGLAIVRRIVESCGGTAAIQETPGGGATVVFDLPG